jgi:APA family basic amino acid/polyamine antiporter
VNIAGLRTSATVTNVLTAGKVIPLFLLAVVGFFVIDPQRYSFAVIPAYGAFSKATLLVMFAFAGFESALIPTGEMRDPQRHLPFSLFVGMSMVTALYIGVQAVCIGTVPDLAHAVRPLSDPALQIVGRAGESAVAAAALISIVGVLNAIVFSTPRLLFAMGQNGELPRVFASTHARFRTPVAAIVATTAAAVLLALFSTFVSALTVSTIARLVAYMATCAALPVMRGRTELPRPSFSAPAGLLIPAAAIALGVWLISNSPWAEVRVAVIFACVGILLYFVSARETRTVTAPVLSSPASD